MVRFWHRLPREAVDAPSMEALKYRLDWALGSLSWWGTALPTAQGGAGWALRSLPAPAVPWFYMYDLNTVKFVFLHMM